eukprot:scaffold408_cov71-Cylindrotheca_fusiformis.AAC.1
MRRWLEIISCLFEGLSATQLVFKAILVFYSKPFIHAVSMPKANSTDGPSDAALSARGDILIRSMFSNGSETIIDVSLIHVDAPSHLSAEPLNVLRTREKTKKKYLKACLQQRHSFVPFVVSTDGLLGPEAQMLVKKLVADLSVRSDQPKSVVTNFIHARLGIAILRATHHCIRGPRIPASKMSRHIEWTGPAGLAPF